MSLEKEIKEWQNKLVKKKQEASSLSVKIEDLKINLNIFLGEYNHRVGKYFVELDKIELNIKEYDHRISLLEKKTLSYSILEETEKDTEEKYREDRESIDDTEKEVNDSIEEYQEEEKKSFSNEVIKKAKTMFRKLAFKYHPDNAKNIEEKRKYEQYFSDIYQSYKNRDLEKLSEYLKQMEKEEKIARETPEEKLERIKDEYYTTIKIIAKLEKELNEIKDSNTYLLKEKVDKSKIEGKDLLQDIAKQIQGDIEKKRVILERKRKEYLSMISSI